MIARALPCLFAFASMACTTVHDVRRTQTLFLHANPDDAAIAEVDGATRNMIGRGDARVTIAYQERVVEVGPASWIALIGGGVTSIAGASAAVWGPTRASNIAGGVALTLGFVALGASIGALIEGEHFANLHVEQPALATFAISKPGFLDRTITVSIPHAAPNIDVQLEPIAVQTAGASEAAKAKNIVAVFDVEDPTQMFEAAERAQLTEYLVAALAATGRFHVVPRDILRAKLIRYKARSFEACFDTSCQIELGKALAAQQSLATRIIALEDRCILTASLYDLKTETTICGSSVGIGCDARSLFGGLTTLSGEIARQAK
jgi:hypothetical protein